MFTTKEIYPSSTFSFGEVSRQRRILPMTIAIGAICADANAVVLIADRTVCSVSDGTTLCCESPGGKLHKWSESIEVVYAGVAEYGGMILHEAQKNSGGMTTVEGVAEAISNEREKLRKRKLKLFRKRLLQRDLLILDSTSEQLKSQSYKELLKGNGWDISFLIAGVDKNVPHLWTIDEDNGLLCRDDRGFVAFGSGEGPAVLSLCRRPGLKHTDLFTVMYSLFEAQQCAHHYIPTIGEKADMVIIKSGECRVTLTPESLEPLVKVYKDMMPTALSDNALKTVQEVLKNAAAKSSSASQISPQ